MLLLQTGAKNSRESNHLKNGVAKLFIFAICLSINQCTIETAAYILSFPLPLPLSPPSPPVPPLRVLTATVVDGFPGCMLRACAFLTTPNAPDPSSPSKLRFLYGNSH